MRNFRNLKVWEKSHALTLAIYKTTKSFSKEELFGLVSQMRRSSSSVPSNIAEGCGRNTQAQFGQFLNIASGSASELEYQIILSRDLDFIDKRGYEQLINKITEVKRMLTSLHQAVVSES